MWCRVENIGPLVCTIAVESSAIIIVIYYPMYIEIRFQWTIHKVGCKFKLCDK